MKAAFSILISLFCGILFCTLAYLQLEFQPKARMTTAEAGSHQPSVARLHQKTEAPAPRKTAEKKGWLEKDAGYCLTVRNNVRNKEGYLDLRTLCLPGGTANGLRVYDSKGKKFRFISMTMTIYLFPVRLARKRIRFITVFRNLNR